MKSADSAWDEVSFLLGRHVKVPLPRLPKPQSTRFHVQSASQFHSGIALALSLVVSGSLWLDYH